MQAVPATLYDRMGGSDAVAALAVETVRRGLADWRIKRFLEGAQDAAAQAQTVSMGRPGGWPVWRQLMLPHMTGGPSPWRAAGPVAGFCTGRAADLQGP